MRKTNSWWTCLASKKEDKVQETRIQQLNGRSFPGLLSQPDSYLCADLPERAQQLDDPRALPRQLLVVQAAGPLESDDLLDISSAGAGIPTPDA